MTEPGDEVPDESGEPESKLDEALGAFKARHGDADNRHVSDASNARPRLNWNPVTDTGTAGPPEAPPRSSFQFDLGSALARLGEEHVDESDEATRPRRPGPTDTPSEQPDLRHEPDVDREQVGPEPERSFDPLPSRTPPPVPPATDPFPTRTPRSEPVAEPLPTRTPRSEPVAEPLPTRTPRSEPVAEPLPTRTPRSEPVAAPLPTRTPSPSHAEPVARAPHDEVEPAPSTAPQPVTDRGPARSVFDDASPAPTLPSAGAPMAPTAASTHASPTAPPTGPVSTAVPSTDMTGLPTLPTAAPAAPPPVVAPIESAPSTPDLNALRSAQIRASRNQRQGKMFGRALLGFIAVGGLIAAALMFGRSYLFQTEWSAELTPIVDEIQLERGADFDHTVAMTERPVDEYAPLATAAILGADWNTRLPEWRALGLAAGDGAAADVEMRIATLYPAFYDADADTIVVLADATLDARESALRLAAYDAFDAQVADGADVATSMLGLTGLEQVDALARRAADAAVVGLAESGGDALVELAGVPLPVAYQLRAIDELGPVLVGATDAAQVGDPLPADADRLVEETSMAAGGLRQPGDQEILAPVSLGADDWTMIWGARMPTGVADRAADALVADSYTVVNRSGSTCFVAVFRFESEAAASSLLAGLLPWTTSAPADARATSTPLGPTQVQLDACDPGATATVTPDPAAVDAVFERQLERLGN